MKLAVVGSRTGFNAALIFDKLLELHPTEIVSGGAMGVDTFAALYANTALIPITVFTPDWIKYGKRAGAIRNKQIVDYCDKLIAFWDGQSPGTKISIDMATKAGKLLNVILQDH